MQSRFWQAWFALAVALGHAAFGCGGRSELAPGSLAGSAGSGSGGAPARCATDVECGDSDFCTFARCLEGACQIERLDCNDGDACNEDACDASIGCVHRPLTSDADGDGFNGPRGGFRVGEVGACGDDCDDESRSVFPGAGESCDGLDNDCNGVIDDGAAYVARQAPVDVSSPEFSRGARGGLAAIGEAFALTYTGNRPPQGAASGVEIAMLKGITTAGAVLFETPVTDTNANSFAGPLAWSGQTLATAWSDARHGPYEIYFRTFDEKGGKRGPEQRVTDTASFSLTPALFWNQSEYLLLWDDRAQEGLVAGDYAQIFGQRALEDGSLFGENLLVVDGPVTENPMLAFGADRIGLAYTNIFAGVSRLGFRVLDAELGTTVTVDNLDKDVEIPSVHFVGDRFLVLWVRNSGAVWGDAIWAAAFGMDGELLLPPRPLTRGARFARSHSELSLGDRLLMVWADDFDGNYELYFQVLAPDLSELAPRQRVTRTAAPSLDPLLAAGPAGTIGVLYNDTADTAGSTRRPYLTTLECVAGRR